MARLVSYKDPGYDDIEARVTASLGLPDGLLGAIRTKGEKSNADQVSSAGARSVYQVIPATRKAAIDRWGIDPYVSAENAAEVAGRLLKENLDRANGDVAEAVAQYHAGTNPRARGPVNRAYVARVTGQVQQAAAKRPVTVPTRVLENYNSGQMTAEQAASFRKAIDAGQVTLPEGAQLNQNVKVQANPGATDVPRRVIENYSDPGSSMTNSQRDLIDRDIAAGTLRLPEGAQLVRPPNPADRSFAENMGRGVRNIATGVGAVGDIAAGALNATINLGSMAMGGDPLLSTSPFRDIANNASDAAGLKAPETRIDRLVAAGSEGAVGGMTGAGAGAALAGLPGAVGATGRMLSAAPILDTVSGATSGVSSEVAAQNGAGPVGQLVAGLAGGVVPVGAVGAARAVAPKARAVVRDTPREVILDDAGKLTDEGREIAAREGVTADELAEAYDAPAETATYRDQPVEIVDSTPVADADGVPHVKVRGEDGSEALVPESEVIPRVEEPSPAAAAIETTSTPPREATGPAAIAPEAEAGQAIPLSKAQETQDYSLQTKENRVRDSDTPEGAEVRQWRADQAKKATQAAENFRAGYGDPNLTAEARGEILQNALLQMKNAGRGGVRALYDEGARLADELGPEAQELIKLDTTPIMAAMRKVIIDEGVDPAVRNKLKQLAAQTGMVGKNHRTNEFGETTVDLSSSDGKTRAFTFDGPVTPATIANAETLLRQPLTKLFMKDSTGALEPVKIAIEDAVAATLEKAANSTTGPKEVVETFQRARGAAREQFENFKAKDTIQAITSTKPGTKTPVLTPEAAIAKVTAGGPEAVTELKKIRARLMAGGQKEAWQAIQAHGIADVFGKTLKADDTISGAKLDSAINRFGIPKLKVLLPTDDFNRLMALNRKIKMATEDVPGTNNYSGSGTRIINWLAPYIANLSGLAKIAPLIGPSIREAETFAAQGAAKKTARDIVAYKGGSAKPAAETKAPTFVKDFLSIASTDRLIAPALAVTQGQQRASQEQASERQAP